MPGKYRRGPRRESRDGRRLLSRRLASARPRADDCPTDSKTGGRNDMAEWTRAALAAALLVLGFGVDAEAQGQQGAGAQGMGFFVASANPGKGGDLGGLAGAD